MKKKLKLGFLASHNGSNMQAIIDAINSGKLYAKPVVLISNNSDSGAMERAKKEKIPCYHISSKTHPEEGQEDKAIANTLEKHNVDLVCLTGYMKKIGPKTLDRYKGRIVNIHPALLPKYGGQGMYGRYVHEAVIKAGEKETGATVHLVDEIYDHGKILAQEKVPIRPDDNPETLAARVHKAEHKLYYQTLQKIAKGRLSLD